MNEAERGVNQEAYLKLRDELEKNYLGQFVGIVGGEMVAYAPTFQEVIAKLDQIEPDPSRRLVFRVGDTYPEEITILHLHLVSDCPCGSPLCLCIAYLSLFLHSFIIY